MVRLLKIIVKVHREKLCLCNIHTKNVIQNDILLFVSTYQETSSENRKLSLNDLVGVRMAAVSKLSYLVVLLADVILNDTITLKA